MKKVLINDDNLDIDDLDYEITRVKGIVINSKNEVLIAFNNNTYQFLGGHVENDEDMKDALLREIKEEAGIRVDGVDGPFMEIITYTKNYFNTGRNVCSKIFYYKVDCDSQPNLDETDYDELEKQSEFGLFYVYIDDFEHFLHNCLDNGTIDMNIGREMLLVLEEYNNLFGGVLL